MIELAIGTKFYYNGKPYKVVDMEHEPVRCLKCDISHCECSMFNCVSTLRQDGKDVCFQMD